MSIKRIIPLIILLLLAASGITYFTLQYLEKAELSQYAEEKVQRLLVQIEEEGCSFGYSLILQDSLQDLRKDPWLASDSLLKLENAYEQCIHQLWQKAVREVDCTTSSSSQISALNDFHKLDVSGLERPIGPIITKTIDALFAAKSLAGTMKTIEGRINGQMHKEYNAGDWENIKTALENGLSQCRTLNSAEISCSCEMSDYQPLSSLLQTNKSKQAAAHLEYVRLKSALKYDAITDCTVLKSGVIPSAHIEWKNYAYYSGELSKIRPSLCAETLKKWPV